MPNQLAIRHAFQLFQIDFRFMLFKSAGQALDSFFERPFSHHPLTIFVWQISIGEFFNISFNSVKPGFHIHLAHSIVLFPQFESDRALSMDSAVSTRSAHKFRCSEDADRNRCIAHSGSGPKWLINIRSSSLFSPCRIPC